MDGGANLVKPGTVIATFFADGETKYPYLDDGSPRHVVIFKGYWLMVVDLRFGIKIGTLPVC